MRNFLGSLPGPVRGVLLLLLGIYVSALLGLATGCFDLYPWFGLTSKGFWHGRFWPILTYWLLPGGWMDLLVNGFMVAWVGARLAREWTRSEWWRYWFVCVLGMGLAQVMVRPHDPNLLVGTSGVGLGLLAACAYEFGHEPCQLLGGWAMSTRTAVALLAVLSLLTAIPCGGVSQALVALGGGLAGWGYLVLRHRLNLAQPTQVVANERMNRLEL